MTFDELVAIAHDLVKSNSEELRELGGGIIDLLAEATPCGWDRPNVIHKDLDGGPWVSAEWLYREVSPEDARHIARMLLRAADEAE